MGRREKELLSMAPKDRQSSAKSLVNLYIVIIGVSLTYGITVLIDPLKGLKSLSFESFWLFLAYLSTLIPFYQGALRHVDVKYIQNTTRIEKHFVMIFDFMLLFAHALGFVVLSVLLRAPGDFAWILVSILSIDIAWGVFAYFSEHSTKKYNATAKWATLNFFAVAVAAIYLCQNEVTLGNDTYPLHMPVFVFLFSLVRTVLDYKICGPFYFPREDSKLSRL